MLGIFSKNSKKMFGLSKVSENLISEIKFVS